MRNVDADKLPVQKIYHVDEAGYGATFYMVDVEDIKAAPTITYEDLVPHAKWKIGKKEKLYFDWEMNGWYDYPKVCSKCRYDATEYGAGVGKFCPNCGAKMDVK